MANAIRLEVCLFTVINLPTHIRRVDYFPIDALSVPVLKKIVAPLLWQGPFGVRELPNFIGDSKKELFKK